MPDRYVLEYLSIIEYMEVYGSGYYFECRRSEIHDIFLTHVGIDRLSPEKDELDTALSKLFYEMYPKNESFVPSTITKPYIMSR